MSPTNSAHVGYNRLAAEIQPWVTTEFRFRGGEQLYNDASPLAATRPGTEEIAAQIAFDTMLTVSASTVTLKKNDSAP